MKNKPLVMIGGGGHAAALTEILLNQNKEVIAVVAPKLTAGRIFFEHMDHFLDDNDIFKFNIEDVILVNGIGSMPHRSLRETVYNRFKAFGYIFATVIADSALVSEYSVLDCGAQIMNNSVVSIGTIIGENSIVNTSVSIDHDCTIGANCHLAPGTTLSGQVIIENNVHVATGVSIINNVTICHNTIIGVGANITESIPSNSIVYGARSAIKELGKANDS